MNGFNSSNEERNYAMFCHLSALAGFVIPFGNIIGPLILWAIKKDQSSLVDWEGKKALNFQISMTIYALVCIPLIFLLIGIPLLVLIGLFQLVYIVIASVKTINGEDFNYPLSIKFLN